MFALWLRQPGRPGYLPPHLYLMCSYDFKQRDKNGKYRQKKNKKWKYDRTGKDFDLCGTYILGQALGKVISISQL